MMVLAYGLNIKHNNPVNEKKKAWIKISDFCHIDMCTHTIHRKTRMFH